MRRLVTIDLADADLRLFEAYEAKVLALLPDHGGRLDLRVRAVDGRSETHLLFFPDPQSYARYRADSRRLAVQDEWARCGARAASTEVEPV